MYRLCPYNGFSIKVYKICKSASIFSLIANNMVGTRLLLKIWKCTYTVAQSLLFPNMLYFSESFQESGYHEKLQFMLAFIVTPSIFSLQFHIIIIVPPIS